MNHPLNPDPRPNLEPGEPITGPMEACGCCRYVFPLNRTIWHTCAECKAECCDDCSMEIKGKWYCAPCADALLDELRARDAEEEAYELHGETV